MLHGKGIFQGDTSYLSFYTFLFTYALFGFKYTYAYYTTVVVFSLSLLLYLLAFLRLFGFLTTFLFSLIIFTSFPFIAVPNFGTTAAFGVVPSAIALFVISKKNPKLSAIILPMCIVSGYFLYGSGVITSLAFLIALPLFFKAYRCLKLLMLSTVSMCGSLILAHFFRSQFVRGDGYFHFGATVFSPENGIESIGVVLNDIFVSATSWYALNLKNAYLGIELQIPILLLLSISAYRYIMHDKKSEVPESDRWALFFITALLLSILLASLVSPPPGVRRVFPAVIPLFALAALGLSLLFNYRRYGILLGCLAMFAVLSLSTAKSIDSMQRIALRGNPSLVHALRSYLRDKPSVDTIYVLKFEAAIKGFTCVCALDLDPSMKDKFKHIEYPSVARFKRIHEEGFNAAPGAQLLIVSENSSLPLLEELQIAPDYEDNLEIEQAFGPPKSLFISQVTLSRSVELSVP